MKYTALIVDDEELVLKSIDKVLTKIGLEVIICHSGEEAVEKIKSETVDLVICDIRMPKMNGVETIRHIRKILAAAKKKPIKEILITGYADENVNEEARALEAYAYLYKPFDTIEFINKVKEILPVNF